MITFNNNNLISIDEEEVRRPRTGRRRQPHRPLPLWEAKPEEESLTNMADAVGQSVDEVVDSFCDGISVRADLSDSVQRSYTHTQTHTAVLVAVVTGVNCDSDCGRVLQERGMAAFCISSCV